jgi:hypothetical protein
MGLALITLVTMTDRPETARWMSEDEKEIAINRVKSERLNQAVLLDKIDGSKLKRGFSNPITLATSCIFLLDNITVLGISFFLPTIISTMYPGRTTAQKQLLTVLPYIIGVACTVIITTLSWRMNSRQTLIALTGPLVVAGFDIFSNDGCEHQICGRLPFSIHSVFTGCYDECSGQRQCAIRLRAKYRYWYQW